MREFLDTRIYKDFDKSMTRATVRAKLNDACAFSIRQRRDVNKIKRELLKATEYKRFKQRRIIAKSESRCKMKGYLRSRRMRIKS